MMIHRVGVRVGMGKEETGDLRSLWSQGKGCCRQRQMAYHGFGCCEAAKAQGKVRKDQRA